MIQSPILDEIYLYNKMKNQNYHTVGTAPPKTTKLSEQLHPKLPHCRNSSNQNYHTVGTAPTKTTTLSEQFQNLEKPKLQHCRNSSKI